MLPELAPITVTWLDLATLTIAVVGLVLGVRSAVREHVRDRVRLVVTPKVAYPVGAQDDPRPRFAFEVVNRSAFPVTVDEVGFLLRGTKHRAGIAMPNIEDGGAWPRRLEPYDGVTVYSTPGDLATIGLARIRCAYASTVSGERFTGNSPALKRLVREGSVPPPPRVMSRSGLRGAYVISDFDDDA